VKTKLVFDIIKNMMDNITILPLAFLSQMQLYLKKIIIKKNNNN